MPNRMLRDYTLSDKVDALSFQAECLFIRLMTQADDYGSFYGNAKIIKAKCFPLRIDTIRDADITRWLHELQTSGLIVVYNNADKPYLRIIDFNQRLRTKTNKFPEPPTNDSNMRTDDSRPPPEEKRREEEIEVEKKGKFFFSLNEIEINNSIEYLDRTAQKKFTSEQVLNFWEGFKIQYGNDYKTDRGEVIKHFRNWLKKQENGKQLNQTGNKSNYGQSAGAISLIERVKEQINQR